MGFSGFLFSSGFTSVSASMEYLNVLKDGLCFPVCDFFSCLYVLGGVCICIGGLSIDQHKKYISFP